MNPELFLNPDVEWPELREDIPVDEEDHTSDPPLDNLEDAKWL